MDYHNNNMKMVWSLLYILHEMDVHSGSVNDAIQKHMSRVSIQTQGTGL